MSITPIVETVDIERLVAFYRDALGASEVRRVPEDGDTFSVDLAVGEARLGIVRAADAEGGYSAPPTPERQAPPGRVLLDFAVQDADEALRRVAAAGSAPDAPNDMPWGLRVGHAQDVDGNPINVSAPIG